MLAQPHVLAATQPPIFISAEAGQAEQVALDAADQASVPPTRRVWAVRFWGEEATACPIGGPTPPPQCYACIEQNVVLDYVTGDFITIAFEGP